MSEMLISSFTCDHLDLDDKVQDMGLPVSDIISIGRIGDWPGVLEVWYSRASYIKESAPSASTNTTHDKIALLEQAYKHLDYPFSEGMRSLTLARQNINAVLAQLH
jgi:hypothetical protein